MGSIRRVGFIGLGAMGRPMARNVLTRGGYALAVHDLRPEPVAELARLGAEPRPSPRAVAADADAVITMLPDSATVEAVLRGPDGVLAGARPGTLVIDMSTIDPAVTLQVGQTAQRAGCRFLDAPVGRTSTHAEAGTLFIMVGGDPVDVAEAEPLLRTMGTDLVHCGPLGAGMTAKVVNNYLSCTAALLTAEALVLGVRAGLELDVLLRVLTATAARTAHLEMTFPAKAFRGDFTPGFLIDLAHKDLGLALRLGAELRVPLALGAVAREAYSAARAQGRGGLDYTGIITGLEELAGVRVRRPAAVG